MVEKENRFLKRPLSYSQLASWEYNKEDWYQNYVKNKPKGKSTAMETGNIIGDSIGTDKSLVPGLKPPGVKEFPLKANLDGIYMVGYADHYCPDTLELNENKTSTNRTKWNQSTVHKHKQLDMYALMLFLQHNVKPEKVTMYLNYIPVIEGPDMRYYLPNPVQHYRFPTKRTEHEVIHMIDYIKASVKAMDEYIEQMVTLEK